MQDTKKLKKKKIIIVTILLSIIFIVGGVTYSWFAYNRQGSNQVLITGNIYLVLESSDTLSISNAVPETEYEARSADGVARTDNMITFTVTGTNTSDKDIYYELVLNEGATETGTRFMPDDIAFDLYEVRNNQDVLLLNAVSYADFTDHKIWVDKIPAGTNTEVTKTYKLREWIAQKVIISDTYANRDYTTSQFSSRYATVKVGADANLTKKDFPLKFAYSNNQFLITLEDEEASTIGLSITTPNSTMKFIDTNDNETTSFSGNYTLAANTPQYITLDVSDIEQYGTDVIFTVTKGGNTIQSFMRTVYNESNNDTIVGYITYNMNNHAGTAPSRQALHEVRNDYVNAFINDPLFDGWSKNANAEIAEYPFGTLINDQEDVTLYAIYKTQNIMDTFPTAITNVKSSIKEVHFIRDTQSNINTAYNAASIKADITYQSNGSVKAWLEPDTVDNTKYIMYIGSNGITYLNTGQGLFNGFTNVQEIDFGTGIIDTSRVTRMSQMFQSCSSLTSIDLSEFNTSNVTSLYYLFTYCNHLSNVNLSSFDTSRVTNMQAMFYGCSSLTNLDVTNFDTSNVTLIDRMFYGCSGLTSLDVTHFNTSSVNNMSGMFYGCSGLTSLDVTHFNTSSVTDMSYMFHGCSGLTSLDVANFDTSSVNNMNGMFSDCTNLETIYVSNLWSTVSVTSSNNMFAYCVQLTGQNGTACSGVYGSANVTATYARIDNPPDAPGYLTYKAAPIINNS